MKNLCSILIGCTLLFSCSQTDNSLPVSHLMAPIPVAPAISQIHFFNYEGNISAKYFLDENGRYIEYTSTRASMIYSYDSENRISNILTQDFDAGTSISYDIVYDSDNRVLSIGDRTFDYDTLNNSYTEEIIYNIDYELIGDIEYVWNLHRKFIFQNLSNPIPQYCHYIELVQTNLVTGEITTSGDCESHDSYQTSYSNNNVTSYGSYESSSHYEYDTEVNPLYDQSTNLPYVQGFLANNETYWTFTNNYLLISANKKTHGEYEPDDPESWEYVYRLNSFNLPINVTIKFFYVGQYEGERLLARYYYQGDDIPDYSSEK